MGNLDGQTLDQAAQDMGASIVWSDQETKTGSLIITAEGIAEYNYLAEHTPFSLSFRVLKDGRMKFEYAELSEDPADSEQVLKLIHQTVDTFKAINDADRFVISVHE